MGVFLGWLAIIYFQIPASKFSQLAKKEKILTTKQVVYYVYFGDKDVKIGINM